ASVCELDTIYLDRDGRRNPGFRPVEIRVLLALGHHELPEKFSRLLVEAHQNPAVTSMLRVARLAIVGADVNAATRDNGCGMRFRSEACDPFDIPAGPGIERFGQTLLIRGHVAGPRPAPLRLVRAAGAEAPGSKAQAQENRQTPTRKPPAEAVAATNEAGQNLQRPKQTSFHQRTRIVFIRIDCQFSRL